MRMVQDSIKHSNWFRDGSRIVDDYITLRYQNFLKKSFKLSLLKGSIFN